MGNFLQGNSIFEEAANTPKFNSEDMIRWEVGESKRIRFLDEIDTIVSYAEHWMDNGGSKSRHVCTLYGNPGGECDYCATGDKPSKRVVGNAVELSPDGNSIVKAGFVQQAVGNFWDTLYTYSTMAGNITGIDWNITRQGTGFDTKYIAINIPSTSIKMPAKKDLAERFGIAGDAAKPAVEQSIGETEIADLTKIIG